MLGVITKPILNRRICFQTSLGQDDCRKRRQSRVFFVDNSFFFNVDASVTACTNVESLTIKPFNKFSLTLAEKAVNTIVNTASQISISYNDVRPGNKKPSKIISYRQKRKMIRGWIVSCINESLFTDLQTACRNISCNFFNAPSVKMVNAASVGVASRRVGLRSPRASSVDSI